MAEANIVTIPEDIIEYRTNKRTKEDLPKSFLVQFVNGRQTEYRRCIACGTKLNAKIPIQQAYEGTEKYATEVGEVKILNHVARNEAAMTSSARSVLSKRIDGNATANGLCHKSGEFFEHIRELKLKENSNQLPSADHEYVVSPSIMSSAEFNREKAVEHFDIIASLPNFRIVR